MKRRSFFGTVVAAIFGGPAAIANGVEEARLQRVFQKYMIIMRPHVSKTYFQWHVDMWEESGIKEKKAKLRVWFNDEDACREQVNYHPGYYHISFDKLPP